MQRSDGGLRLLTVNATMAHGADEPGARASTSEDQAKQVTVAVTDLFREHHLELVRLALIIVGDLATAEDIVQDAFEKLHRGWHSLRTPENGLAYARASVINGCRSVHRRAAVARMHAPQLAGLAAEPGPEANVADRDELETALRSLPRRQREVLVLRFYVGLDVAEIASTLRIAPSAVRSNCSRGLATLARSVRRDDL
jgi:RNA polymerase sigma factor (sigma-70 family)